jgi:hypothetical protein
MEPFEALVTVIAIVAFFGTSAFFFNGVFKLIRYRIDRKHQVSDKSIENEMRLFMDRTERRLQALEHIVSDDITEDTIPDIDYDSPIGEPAEKEKNKGRLRNQLKS